MVELTDSTVPETTPGASGALFESQPRSLMGDAVRRFRRRKSAMLGLLLVMIFLLTAAVGTVYSPQDANKAQLSQRLKPPTSSHLLGTDGFGRDMLSRSMRAAPLALAVGVVSVLIGSVLGSIQGLVAGYFRGWIGAVIMRITDALLAFPLILLALALIATLGTGVVKVMIAIGISSMPRFARIMQSDALSVGRRDYILAARALGASRTRILFRHVLPSSFSSVLVMGTLYISTAILTEASLSFLGLGPPPPTATWGSMINDGSSLLRSAPWISFFPGIAIMIAVLGFSLVGDGLRDAFDIKLQSE